LACWWPSTAYPGRSESGANLPAPAAHSDDVLAREAGMGRIPQDHENFVACWCVCQLPQTPGQMSHFTRLSGENILS